jgi:hypothetical protein
MACDIWQNKDGKGCRLLELMTIQFGVIFKNPIPNGLMEEYIN